jgi:hypothetical protein
MLKSATWAWGSCQSSNMCAPSQDHSWWIEHAHLEGSCMCCYGGFGSKCNFGASVVDFTIMLAKLALVSILSVFVVHWICVITSQCHHGLVYHRDATEKEREEQDWICLVESNSTSTFCPPRHDMGTLIYNLWSQMFKHSQVSIGAICHGSS